jgi:hypothetical protein
MDSRGYSDIAYNALVGPSGRIYEGRSLDIMGAHSDGEWHGADANRTLLGICFLGNFEVSTLTVEAREAALLLEYLWGLKVGHALQFCTHRETKSTACPGGDVQRWVDRRRR